ncbi:MAG: glucokinase [Kangiellaceae bacterium]|nr:glucokinase [Kangiellaceae bacterium]
MTTEYPYIVADIGGTNARFGLVSSRSANSNYNIEAQLTFPSGDFQNIDDATFHYMNEISESKLSGACLAIAGPVNGDKIRLTNLDWDFSRSAVEKSLNLNHLKIINDFAAHAFATPFVDKKSLINLNPGVDSENLPLAVLGPGTGFGMAGLIFSQGKWNVLPTEGGHITLASKNPLQSEIVSQLNKEFDHVSVETVFSGPGLANLYRALTAVEDNGMDPLTAPDIVRLALTDSSSASYRTLLLFCNWLGQVTGDLALTLGANGGVYLGGGILMRFSDFLQSSDFMKEFVNKGQLRTILEDIPVNLVTEGNSALLGAAAYFDQQ